MALRASVCCLLLLLSPAAAWACRVCRPRVQAAIHGPDYSVQLALLLLPVGVVLAVGLGVFFWGGLRRRFIHLTSIV